LDIQINYEDVDRKAAVKQELRNIALARMKMEPIGLNFLIDVVTDCIDRLYTEGGKEIESVSINKNGTLIDIKYIVDNRNIASILTNDSYGETQIIFSKCELSQYIELLQKIHRQMK